MLTDERIFLLGIRHHGPGSAASIVSALEEIKPDVILIEGPEEADSLLKWAGNKDMKPPIAMMTYTEKDLKNAVYFPFATFSPEWQAIQFGVERNIPVRFIDLPQRHQLHDMHEDTSTALDRQDPIKLLAQAAGFEDSEAWWEFAVEQRLGDLSLFKSIAEAMIEVRSVLEGENPDGASLLEQRREAWMRRQLRKALSLFSGNIAVICGAWHVPALFTRPTIKSDDALLKGMKKVSVSSTWIPWTYQRLSFSSGYGAGVTSPAWYDMIFESRNLDSTERQLHLSSCFFSMISAYLRNKGHETSAARVIDAVQLCQMLSLIRDQPIASIKELQDAALSTLFKGDVALLGTTLHDCMIGDVLGSVSNDIPQSPLQRDFHKKCKSYRLVRDNPSFKLKLDLRKSNDLIRSEFLHQLALLDVSWAQKGQFNKNQSGTFQENWDVSWSPEIELELIDAGYYGSTVLNAVANKIQEVLLPKSDSIQAILNLVKETLLANLVESTKQCLEKLSDVTGLSADILELLRGVPELVTLCRYGDVRNTHTEILSDTIDNIVPRVCIGLPGAVTNIDQDSSDQIAREVRSCNRAITLYEDPKHINLFLDALNTIASIEHVRGVIGGTSSRILLDHARLSPIETRERMNFVMSRDTDFLDQAQWIIGFIDGSVSTLLYDEDLWGIIKAWVAKVPEDDFIQLLPLLRNGFSGFSTHERHKLMEKIRNAKPKAAAPHLNSSYFDQEIAGSAVAVLSLYYGLTTK